MPRSLGFLMPYILPTVAPFVLKNGMLLLVLFVFFLFSIAKKCMELNLWRRQQMMPDTMHKKMVYKMLQCLQERLKKTCHSLCNTVPNPTLWVQLTLLVQVSVSAGILLQKEQLKNDENITTSLTNCMLKYNDIGKIFGSEMDLTALLILTVIEHHYHWD